MSSKQTMKPSDYAMNIQGMSQGSKLPNSGMTPITYKFPPLSYTQAI